MKRIFNDNESEKDYIGYEPYINVFKYIIEDNNNLLTPPIVFGLHGEWGMGKSTFMNILKNKIENKNDNLVLKINPWEYRDEDLTKIFFVELFKKLRNKKLGEEVVDKLFQLIYPMKLSFQASKLLKVDYDVSKIKEIEKINMLDTYINGEYSLKEKVEAIINSKDLKVDRIIVFIDDLDRCPVDTVVNVLKSIKLFLNTSKCIFVLGCDLEYLNSAIAQNYKEFIIKKEDDDSYDEVQKFSRRYLEKMIQIPFNIPKIDSLSAENYIDVLLGKKAIREEIDNNKFFNTVEKDIFGDEEVKFIKKISGIGKMNPRRIKININNIYINYLFLLSKEIQNNSGDDKKVEIDPLDRKLLILISLLQEVDMDEFREQTVSKEKFSNYLKNIASNKEINSSFEKMVKTYIETVGKNKKLIGTKFNDIITVSSTTKLNYKPKLDWGDLGSIGNTDRKLKRFLNTLNEYDLESIDIFTKNEENIIKLYRENKLFIGVPKDTEVLFYKIENNKKSDFIFKFRIDESLEKMMVFFKTTINTSYLFNEKDYLKEKCFINMEIKTLINQVLEQLIDNIN